MIHRKFFFKRPESIDEKNKVTDGSDGKSFLTMSMGNMLATDKPVFYSVDIDDDFKGTISVFYIFDREQKIKSESVEYGVASGRLFEMSFSSKDEFDKSRERWKSLYHQFENENTLSMRKRNNSSFAKRVVEQIAKYIEDSKRNIDFQKESVPALKA